MKEIFNEILDTFESDQIRQYAEVIISKAPPYFWEVPASSSFKYHPRFACETPLGLAKHTVALCRYLNYLFEIDSVAVNFTSVERDLLRCAGIVHDMWKSGTQEEYEKSKYTKFNHPLIAANMVMRMTEIPENYRQFIAIAVSAHMGQWNTDKRHPDIVLPKPEDKYQIILHVADYLASRRDIDMKFEAATPSEPEPLPDVNTWQMDFGKYRGMTLVELKEKHPDYIEWIKKQEGFNREPCKSLLIQMGYTF